MKYPPARPVRSLREGMGTSVTEKFLRGLRPRRTGDGVRATFELLTFANVGQPIFQLMDDELHFVAIDVHVIDVLDTAWCHVVLANFGDRQPNHTIGDATKTPLSAVESDLTVALFDELVDELPQTKDQVTPFDHLVEDLELWQEIGIQKPQHQHHTDERQDDLRRNVLDEERSDDDGDDSQKAEEHRQTEA